MPDRSPLTRPRGRLPQRVYWFRRGLVLLTALALVFGIARLLGAGGGSPSDGTATMTAARTTRNTAPAQSRVVGPAAVATTPVTGRKHQRQPAATAVATPLAVPTGPCQAPDVIVTPVVGTAAAGGRITIGLGLTGTQPACTFTVSPRTVVLKVISGTDRIWSSQDCPKAIPTRTVAVRSGVSTTVPVTWSGRRSDGSCSRATAWAEPGYYHALAAALGSQPSDVQFRLTLPSRPVVTRTARPTPRPRQHQQATSSPSPSSSPSPTSSPTTKVKGKQSSCGGDNVC
ncbi:MAG TPA: hypothetical protein VFM09_10360 [Marmoricola sp.]|nr:hypothetical protein [Marmoricola sp.]